MKQHYFVLLVLILLIACKKEIAETIVKEEAGFPITAKPNCTGNTWQADNGYHRGYCADAPNDIPPLVYNNKAYTFHPGNLGQVEVKIYDGTNWASVMSSVPDSYPLCHAYFGFVIGNKGYLAGFASSFEYAFETNTWTTKAAFPGSYRTHAATFSIGTKGYIVGGSSLTSNTINYYDTWEFNPTSNQWLQKNDLPRGAARTATGFSIGGKGYIVNGYHKNGNTTVYLKDLFEYDPVSDLWSYKTFFPGDARRNTSVFVIGSVAYAGAGRGDQGQNVFGNLKDFYKYTASSNSWQQVADISPFDVKDPSKYGFAINNRGYVVFDSHTSDPDYYLTKYTPLSCTFPLSPQP